MSRLRLVLLGASLLAIGPCAVTEAAAQWSPSLPSWSTPAPAPSPQAPPASDRYGAAGPTLPGPPEQVPVDGGLALLALAGAAYGARRLYRGA